MEALFGLILIVAAFIWWGRRFGQRREEEKKQEVLSYAYQIVENHAATLYRKKLQKMRHDDYGNSFDADWLKERTYFYEAVTVPQLLQKYSQEDIAFYDSAQDAAYVENVVKEYAESASIEEINVERLKPIEFEAHCASLLAKAGWTARVTQASGDQGVDIIAERNGIKAVFK